MIGPIQEAWLSALESGEYEQGHNFLCIYDAIIGNYKYCCLGVFCTIIKDIEIEEDGCVRFFNGESRLLGNELYNRLGLYNDAGAFKIPYIIAVDGNIFEYNSLVSMNDECVSFKEIAAYCRANPENVFERSC